jgi:predicted metallo-beta-lactamase superfamily hydrolase
VCKLRALCRDRAHEHDASAVDEAGDQPLCDEERACKVHIDLSIEVFAGGLGERLGDVVSCGVDDRDHRPIADSG